MPRTSQLVLMNVKDAVEGAVYNVVSSSCGIINRYSSREDVSVETPNVEILFTQTATPFHAYFSASTVVNDAWAGSVVITVQTDRAINEVSHSHYVSNVMNIMANPYMFNTGSLLPHHSIASAVFNGMNTATMEDTNLDLTTLSYTWNGFINPSSW